MTFRPSSSLLKIAQGTELEAFSFLHQLQPETPFQGLLYAYPLDTSPPPPPAALDQTPLPRGPLSPAAICPETGQPLRLHVFRDLSAVILRLSPAGVMETLPATFVLPSTIYGEGFRDIPFMERKHRASSLSFQGRPEGVFWSASNTDLTDDGLAQLMGTAMRVAARIVLEALPVSDPRAHADPLPGSRFAPHAHFPCIDETSPHLNAFAELLRAIGSLRALRETSDSYDIHIFRSLPDEPCRLRNASSIVGTHSNRPGRHPVRDKALDRALRKLLTDPELAPPACYRHGPENQTLIRIKALKPPSSNHQAMQLHHIIGKVSEREEIRAVLTPSKGSA